MNGIQFKRVERSCPRNTAINSGDFKWGKKRIYDFEILVNGEHVATWQWVLGHKYWLIDLIGHNIRDKHTCRVTAYSQAEFAQLFFKARAEGLVPTKEQCDVRTAEIAAKEKAAKRERAIIAKAAESFALLERIVKAGALTIEDLTEADKLVDYVDSIDI